MTTRFVFIVIAAAGLDACGGESDVSVLPPATCSSAEALQTVASSSGAYNISACAATAVARGENAFAFAITDATTGAAMDGLTVSVQPWMPDMGHGSSATPSVTSAGGGLYDVTDCVFQMGGLWQLRTTIAGGAQGGVSDDAIVQFTID